MCERKKKLFENKFTYFLLMRSFPKNQNQSQDNLRHPRILHCPHSIFFLMVSLLLSPPKVKLFKQD